MYIARNEDEACFCRENVCEETGRRANSRRWKCSNCRKHEGHQHCDQCHACMGDEDGLCEACALDRMHSGNRVAGLVLDFMAVR